MKTQIIQLFEDKPNVTLISYLYGSELERIGNRVRPAILICGGGAYFACSDTEGEPVALSFMAMGYQAFVLKYSTYGEDAFIKHFQNMDRRPQTEYPNQVREIAKAVLTIKEHASEWHVDPDKIIVCGFSAGGHNAAMYSTLWHTPLIAEYYHRPAEEFRVAATILGYALTDYVYMKEFTRTNSWAKQFFNASNIAFVGTPDPDGELLKAISPALNVTENTPPAFIWATTADETVPVQNSLYYAMALSEKHIPYELHIFEEGEHGLSLATQASAGALNQIDRDVQKWVSLADAWLQKRFALDMPETYSFADADKELANKIGIG